MIDENTINERIKILDSDIAKVQTTMQSLEKQTKDAIAMMNALQGAKQQCESFLKELNNGEPEVSDSSDVGEIPTVTFPAQLSDGFILGRSD